MNRLNFREKTGYSFAALGDSAAYMFIGTFLMFFLTTVAGLAPAVAGTITAIGAVWNSLFNPVMGYISDHAMTRWGRRRPFMFAFAFPLMIAVSLLFTTFDIPYGFKILYYSLGVIIFWTSYTGFFVPYLALGAEYTQDYNERTVLRSYASFFNLIGSVISMSLPTMMVELMQSRNISTQMAWSVTGIFIATAVFVSIMITVRSARHKDKYVPQAAEDRQRVSIVKMFREYFQVLKLKPMKCLLFASLFFLTAYGMFMSDIVYYCTYNQGMSSGQISGILFFRAVISMTFIPFIAAICKKTDKRTGLILLIGLSAVLITVEKIAGVHGTFGMYVFIFCIAVGAAAYWQIMPAIIYDVCEYDQYTTGNQRQGTIVSLQGLVEAIASGIGTQMLGIILQLAGFDGAQQVQSAGALEWIENCTTFVPAIFMAASCYALYRYHITKAVFNEIKAELDKKKQQE